MKNFNKIASSLGKALYPSFLELLKDKAVKAALKKFLGTAVTGGLKATIIKFVIEEAFDEIAVPVANAVATEGGFVVHKVEGKVLVKKLQESQNVQDYNNTVDDILS